MSREAMTVEGMEGWGQGRDWAERQGWSGEWAEQAIMGGGQEPYEACPWQPWGSSGTMGQWGQEAEQAEGVGMGRGDGEWDHGPMGPGAMVGAMGGRAEGRRAKRAEQAEGAGMDWGPLKTGAL